MTELAAKAGFSVKFGPAHSPWANGLNERNHATADQIVKKLMFERKYISLKEAVSMASWCHNTNVNRAGYSPSQLATGKSAIIPGISTAELTATSAHDSVLVKEIMDCFSSTMKDLRTKEYSEKILQMANTNKRSYMDITY